MQVQGVGARCFRVKGGWCWRGWTWTQVVLGKMPHGAEFVGPEGFPYDFCMHLPSDKQRSVRVGEGGDWVSFVVEMVDQHIKSKGDVMSSGKLQRGAGCVCKHSPRGAEEAAQGKSGRPCALSPEP